MVDKPPRPRGLRAPYSGDTGSFGINVNVGPDASMSSLVEVVKGLEALTDVGLAWGYALARSAAMWDMTDRIRREGPAFLFDEAARQELPGVTRRRLDWLDQRWDRGWGSSESPEVSYLRDVRANQLLGRAPHARSLTYENPIELIVSASGLALAGTIMAGKFVRDWSANRRIGLAEARKAEAEARVAETWALREEAVTEALTRWLSDEARRSATPLPIGEMAAITSLHNFDDLRRIIERPIRLELPRGLDPTATDDIE